MKLGRRDTARPPKAGHFDTRRPLLAGADGASRASVAGALQHDAGNMAVQRLVEEARAPTVQRALDATLEIGGAKQKLTPIKVRSFSFGGAMAHEGGRAAGKAAVKDVSFVKELDENSPALFQLMMEGEPVAKATLRLARPSAAQEGAKEQYFRYKFSDALVTGVQQGGGAGEGAMESVSMTFSKFEMVFEGGGRAEVELPRHRGR